MSNQAKGPADKALLLRAVLSTADGRQRLAEQPPLLLRQAALVQPPGERASVMVHSERRFQTLLGFGAAFTEAAPKPSRV